MQPLHDGAVVAVVVTRHRPTSLATSLAAIAAQDRPVDHLVVVDNGPDRPCREVVEAAGVPATWIPSWTNLGGAGGYALGMLHALAMGASWVWLGDDDGRPAGQDVLATLLACAEEHSFALVAPVVVDEADSRRLSFPVRRGHRWSGDRAALGASGVVHGFAALFNGALLRAEAMEVLGTPDYRLFLRGDEVEFHRRLVRSGLPFGTCLAAAYAHPAAAQEYRHFLFGLLTVVAPADATKRYFLYRNQGYLNTRPGRRLHFVVDAVRYPLYFLLAERDPHQLRAWWRASRLGRRERFLRPGPEARPDARPAGRTAGWTAGRTAGRTAGGAAHPPAAGSRPGRPGPGEDGPVGDAAQALGH